MNKLKVLIAAVLTFFCGHVAAQRVAVANVSVAPNSTADLVISITGSTDIASVAQMVLTLPEGVEIQRSENEDGDLVEEYKLGEILRSSEAVNIVKKKDGSYGIQLYNAKNLPFKAATGTVLTLPVKITNLADGTYKGTLKDIGFYINSKQAIAGTKANGFLDDTDFTITVSSELTGINTIEADKLAKAGKVYNLQGQRVSSTKQGGLYIVDGKKVVVK